MTTDAEPRSGRSDLDTDSNSHSVSSFAGVSRVSVAAASLLASALSNAVGRTEISLRGESLEMTLARAFPA